VDEHELLKPEEVGRILKTGRSKTYELLASGDLPSIRIGRKRGSIRVSLSKLTQWIEQKSLAEPTCAKRNTLSRNVTEADNDRS
jgi:excisionase family DNA binding protein